MHTVNRRLQFTTRDGVLAILEVVDFLVGAAQWIRLRREYLDRWPDLAPKDDHRLCRIAREVVYVLDLLEPAQAKRYFGFEKRQRRYLCPGCEHECIDWDIGVTLAQLRPNTPESTTVYCILCGQNHDVVREDCGLSGCLGNVLSVDYGTCLTCGSNRPDVGGAPLPVVPEDPSENEQAQESIAAEEPPPKTEVANEQQEQHPNGKAKD